MLSMGKPQAPLRYISNNVVYGRGGLKDGWACFVLAPGGSDYRPLAARLGTMRSFSQFLNRVKRDGQLVRLARQWPADRYLQSRRERSAPMGLGYLRDQWVAEQAMLVDEKRIDAALPRIFLAVRLNQQLRDLQERVTTGEPARKMVDHFGVAGRMFRDGLLPDSQRESDQHQAQSLLAELTGYPALASAVPASTADLQWWIRRVYARGLEDPHVDPQDIPQGVLIHRDGQAAVRPLEVDLLRWTGGVESHPVRRPDHVVSSAPEGGAAVQQTLMATSWHETADSAERALGLALVAPRQLDWPIDLAVSWEWHSNEASRRAMDRRAKETLEDAKQEHTTQLGVSERTGQAYAASHGLLARLESSGEPTLRAVVTAAIAVPVDEDAERPARAVSDAVRELRRRSRTTRSLIEQSCGVSLQVPPVQQVVAMQQMLPGQTNLLPGYARISLPDQVAAQAWTSGTDIGSESGWLWGRTVSRRPQPVRMDLTDPARLGCAAGMLWLGDSGGGKTFAAGLALVLAVLGGAWVVNSDPKGDHKWHRVLPEELVQEIRLDQSDRQQWGMLDPFIVAPPARRADVAASWLTSLLPRQSTAEMDVALREAIADVVRTVDGPTCSHVLERLGERAGKDRAAELVLRSLTAASEGGLARLAFAEPGRTGIQLGTAQVTSIVSNTFVRPKAGVPRDQWKSIEVASMGLVELVGHLTTRLVTDERDTLKILNSDEAHADLATDLGRGQIDAAQRMGRSELLVPSLATQAPSDLTDAGLKNLFGQYALFRAMDEQEAIAGLTLAGLDVDEEIVTKLVELPPGHALLRDYRGRAEWVNVLAPPSYVRAVSEVRDFETLDEFTAV